MATTADPCRTQLTPVSSVGYLAAFGGGVVSFLSPCVLPIVPAYLSVLTGLDLAEIEHGSRRQMLRIGRDTSLFISGFSAVFIALGLTATSFGHALVANQTTITRIAGLLLLAFALFILGSLVLQAPWLYQEKRFHPTLSRFGPFAAPITGAAFGFGWTPCIGPILGSVLAVAATSGHTAEGGLLLAFYSAGLGLPFLATGLAFDQLTGILLGQATLHRHHDRLSGLAGLLRHPADPQPADLGHQPTPDGAGPCGAARTRITRLTCTDTAQPTDRPKRI